jgi:hypothetical protein
MHDAGFLEHLADGNEGLFQVEALGVHLRVEHGAPKAALARMLIRASVSIPPLSYSSRMDWRMAGLRSFILRSSVLPSVASRQAGTLSNRFQS